MPYDYGRKEISKGVGLTGVESKNIARKLKESDIDPQAIDWEGAISDASDYGDRYGATVQKLKDYYGVDIGKEQSFSEHKKLENDRLMNELMRIFESRSRASKLMDLNIDAKSQFKPSNKPGVKLWKKYPNEYDIIGIDNAVIDMDYPEAHAKTGMSMMGDADGDKVPNILDCKPLDPNRDGVFGRAINVLSRGKYGQTKQDFETEKTLKRVVTKKKLEAQIANQKAVNALVMQQNELRQLKFQKQQLMAQGKMIPKPSVARTAVSMLFGGLPQPRMMTQIPSVQVKKPVSKTPKKGKVSKSHKKQSSRSAAGCPFCGLHLKIVPNLFGQPVLVCPRCGYI